MDWKSWSTYYSNRQYYRRKRFNNALLDKLITFKKINE